MIVLQVVYKGPDSASPNFGHTLESTHISEGRYSSAIAVGSVCTFWAIAEPSTKQFILMPLQTTGQR